MHDVLSLKTPHWLNLILIYVEITIQIFMNEIYKTVIFYSNDINYIQ